MSIPGLILLILLIMLLMGSVPTWPHSRNWGYGPSGGLGLILVIVLVLVLMRAIYRKHLLRVFSKKLKKPA